MSDLKISFCENDNLIKATEKAIKKIVESSDYSENNYIFFSVSELYKEPRLAREIILKETEGKNPIFGIISSGSIFTNKGLYKKGVIIGEKSASSDIRVETILVEGRSKNLYKKIDESINYFKLRKNGDDLKILTFIDDDFYYKESLFKHIKNTASTAKVKIAGGFTGESISNMDASGLFYNNPIIGKSMLLIGIFTKSKDNDFSVFNKTEGEKGSKTKQEEGGIVIGPSLTHINDNIKRFLQEKPFLGIGTNMQFYFNSENDNKISNEIFIKTIF